MIKVDNLSLSYSQKASSLKVLKNISFEVQEGTTCAIIGPSGCGKTTLLYSLAGLVYPDRGEILIKGKSPVENKKSIAVILQQYGLLPWKNVKSNIAMGLKLREFKKAKCQKRVYDILKELEIEDYENYYPSQLSGGQQQRVAIARALALKPDVLLMDEPFSSLDALTRENIQKLFLALWKKYLMTAVIVTHSIEEAVFLGKKIIILSPRPGEIIARIDNEYFAKEGWRSDNSFYGKCQEIRLLLEAGMKR